MSWTQKAEIALDIAKGLRYLHSKGIAQHTLTTGHVIFFNGTVKLYINRVGTEDHRSNSNQPMDCNHLRYFAPELFYRLPDRDTKATDIYSLGIMLIEMASLSFIFNELFPRQIVKWVSDNKELPIPQDIPSSFASLCKRCCSFAPSDRPKIEEVVDELECLQSEFEDTERTPNSCEKEKFLLGLDFMHVHAECLQGFSLFMPRCLTNALTISNESGSFQEYRGI